MIRRTARRWIARAALCLLAGAATTLAVAWAIQLVYLRAGGPPRRLTVCTDGRHLWQAGVWTRPGERVDFVAPTLLPHDPSLPALRAPRWVPLPETASPVRELRVAAHGWPMLAVKYERRTVGGRGPWTTELRGAWQAVPDGWIAASKPAGLGVLPLWPGFAVNTAVYAAALWCAWAAWGRARPARRRRRGRCPRCAYDLRGTTGPCPECGTPQESAP